MHTSLEEFKLPAHLKGSGKVISPLDFKDYREMLERVSPHLICFLALEDNHQVCLNAIAKEIGIQTFHIEHGVRDRKTSIEVSRWRSSRSSGSRRRKKHQGSIWKRIEMRRLLNRSSRRLTSAMKKEFDEYREFRNSHDIMTTAKEFCGTVHLPSLYISFSPAVFDFHRSKCVPEQQEVAYIGHPGFDDLADMRTCGEQRLFFIDQPFVEQGLFGWTVENKKAFIMELRSLAETHSADGLLHVKKHPYSSSDFWSEFGDGFRIVEMEDFCSNGIYIGFASTLLIPLAAKEDSVVFSMQNHPSIDFEYGSFLLEDGAITPVKDMQSLDHQLSRIDEIHKAQRTKKKRFMEKWMMFDDGLSKERLTQHLRS